MTFGKSDSFHVKFIYCTFNILYFTERYRDEMLYNKAVYKSFTFYFLQCCATHSFANALLRQIRLSVCHSDTLQYCAKVRECSPVFLVLWCQEWVMGDDPCLGNICMQRGRPPAKTVELYTFRLITPEPLWIAEKVRLSQTES